MKAASRVAVCAVIIAAAGPFAAYAISPASNGVGDGEANVPFASPLVAAQEGTGRAAAAGVRDPGDRGDRPDRAARRDRDRDAAGRVRDRAPDSGCAGASCESPHAAP